MKINQELCAEIHHVGRIATISEFASMLHEAEARLNVTKQSASAMINNTSRKTVAISTQANTNSNKFSKTTNEKNIFKGFCGPLWSLWSSSSGLQV